MAASASYRTLEYYYVSEPDDDLLCPICLEVARDPLQHEACGKLFCKECIEEHGKDQPCPHCSTEGLKFYQDKIGRKHVLALGVKCNDDAESECKWEGTVYQLEEHVASCKCALVACPKQCRGVGNRINHFSKSDLEQHLKEDCLNREYECEHCGKKDTYGDITRVHDKICEKKILPCPNDDCTDRVERQGIKRHLDDCDHTEIPCKYHDLGCSVWMKRKDIGSHENEDKLHLHMGLDTVATMSDKLAELEEKVGVIGVIIRSK